MARGEAEPEPESEEERVANAAERAPLAERFESALWRTSSLLIVRGEEAVVVDPAVSADEVAAIAARAGGLGARVTHVIVTHADWDHVCGIAAFPEAVVVAGEATAGRIASRRAGSLAERAQAAGIPIAGDARVDREFVPGTAQRIGPFVAETLALPGHTPDGVAYRFRDPDVLAVGDHLSTAEFPFASAPAGYRATLAALSELLRRDPPARVVPGHGPELTAEAALAVADGDLAYLWSLHAAVVSAPDAAGARAAALAVPVPRPAPDDLAEAHEANVEAAVAEIFGGGD